MLSILDLLNFLTLTVGSFILKTELLDNAGLLYLSVHHQHLNIHLSSSLN